MAEVTTSHSGSSIRICSSFVAVKTKLAGDRGGDGSRQWERKKKVEGLNPRRSVLCYWFFFLQSCSLFHLQVVCLKFTITRNNKMPPLILFFLFSSLLLVFRFDLWAQLHSMCQKQWIQWRALVHLIVKSKSYIIIITTTKFLFLFFFLMKASHYHYLFPKSKTFILNWNPTNDTSILISLKISIKSL